MHIFQYWRHNYNLGSYGAPYCNATSGDGDMYGIYARLENPLEGDQATLSSNFDKCIGRVWGMNYKKGN